MPLGSEVLFHHRKLPRSSTSPQRWALSFRGACAPTYGLRHPVGKGDIPAQSLPSFPPSKQDRKCFRFYGHVVSMAAVDGSVFRAWLWSQECPHVCARGSLHVGWNWDRSLSQNTTHDECLEYFLNSKKWSVKFTNAKDWPQIKMNTVLFNISVVILGGYKIIPTILPQFKVCHINFFLITKICSLRKFE